LLCVLCDADEGAVTETAEGIGAIGISDTAAVETLFDQVVAEVWLRRCPET
jgi:hypothetical protein